MLKVRKTWKDSLVVDSSFTLCCQTAKFNWMLGINCYLPTSHSMMLIHVYISALISSSVSFRMDCFLHTFTAVHWLHDHVISLWHMLISSHLFALGEMWHFISLCLQVCTQKWHWLLSNINKLLAIIFWILVDLNADECVSWSAVRLWGHTLTSPWPPAECINSECHFSSSFVLSVSHCRSIQIVCPACYIWCYRITIQKWNLAVQYSMYLNVCCAININVYNIFL